MNVNDVSYQQLKLVPSPETDPVESADQLLAVLKQFPNLMTDKQIQKETVSLVEKIFAKKEELLPEKEKKITQLFYTLHGLKPTRFEQLTDAQVSVKQWAKEHQEAQSIMQGNQKYPIPKALMQNETTLCSAYFKSIPVSLSDGNIEISQGLLAHYSDMVKAMVNHQKMKLDLKIDLSMVNTQHFDQLMAYLETGNSNLIHPDNVLQLLRAGDYLQMPAAVKACTKFMLQNSKKLPLQTIAEALTLLGSKNKEFAPLEAEIAKFISSGLSKKTFSNESLKKEFLTQLETLKTYLKHPLTLTLGNPDIDDVMLKCLSGLPLYQLGLIRCNGLTKDALETVGSFPDLKILHLEGSLWVDDKALVLLPENVKELFLTGCKNITKQGLIELQKSKVSQFHLANCTFLNDDDFSNLPLHFQEIDLAYTQIGEKTMKRLSQMKDLQHLNLAATSITDVSDLPLWLKTLNLSGCALKNEAFDRIALMKNLEKFITSKALINDSGVEKLPLSIVHLELQDLSEITDQCLSSLAQRKNLAYLKMTRCPKISHHAQVEAFRPTQVRLESDHPSLTQMIAYK